MTDVLQREDYQRLDDAIAVASGKMRASFDEQTEDTVRKALHHEMKKGAVRAGFTLDSVVARFDQTQILDGMVRSAKFYTDSYFDKFVVPKLHKAVTEKFIQGNPDADSLHFIQKMLSEKLEGNHYWHVVGNASASRSYHYGVLKSGVMTRQLGYQVYAIIDDRTSSICKEMDGKEFWVADAVHVIERSAKAESAEEVKELQPWLKYSEIRELSTDELVSKGVMVPPFHGLCRSTIELVDVL